MRVIVRVAGLTLTNSASASVCVVEIFRILYWSTDVERYSSSASIFDHGIEMMQLDPFRQFGPFFFTQTDHIELLHNHPSQLWPAAYWEATYHTCALR